MGGRPRPSLSGPRSPCAFTCGHPSYYPALRNEWRLPCLNSDPDASAATAIYPPRARMRASARSSARSAQHAPSRGSITHAQTAVANLFRVPVGRPQSYRSTQPLPKEYSTRRAVPAHRSERFGSKDLMLNCPAPPNPSFNRTSYGRPPWPELRYAVRYLSSGQGVLPPLAG